MAFTADDVKALKGRLGLPCAFTQEDELLLAYLNEVRAAWLTATSRPRFFNGDAAGTFYFQCKNQYEDAVIIPHRPVIEVTGVWIDWAGAFGQGEDSFSDDPLEVGVDYCVNNLEENEQNPALLMNLSGSAWPTTPGSIKMTAKVGYSADGLPLDVVGALYNAATILRGTAPDGGLLTASEKIGNYSYQLLTVGGMGASPEQENTLSSIRATVRRYRECAG